MALEAMLYDDNTASETYELYGPKRYSMARIGELVNRETLRNRRHVNVPKIIMKPIANILNKAIYWPTMSPDEVEREFIDQVIDPKAKTFKDLGIEPAELRNLTFHYLVSHAAGRMSERPKLTNHLATLPELVVLRSAISDREREEGREEIPACLRRSIKAGHGGRMVSTLTTM